MEDWNALIPWIGQVTGAEPEADFFNELWDGVLLCEVINGISPGTIEIQTDFETNERAAVTNLQNFQTAAKELGVDEAHMFDMATLYESTEPDAEILNQVRETLAALKAIVEQRGTLEQQNIWRKEAAEVRAKQNDVKYNYAKKEDKTLTDVTSAVRTFKETTNKDADLRYNNQGQQKWKLFETNYQREKGISLEQSLEEIEEFERTGKIPASMAKKNATQREVVGVSTGFSKTLTDTLNKDATKKSTNQTSTNTFQAGSSTSSNTPGKTLTTGQRDLNEKPKTGGGSGAEFYKKFAANEKKKYQPGNSNAPSNQW